MKKAAMQAALSWHASAGEAAVSDTQSTDSSTFTLASTADFSM